MTTQSEQAFYQNATSNSLLVKKLVRNEEIINYFIGDAYGPLNEEVILFVDYKKDYYTLDLFVSVFNEYLKDEAKSEIENFMKDYKQWNYYMIKEFFRLLKSKYLLKD